MSLVKTGNQKGTFYLLIQNIFPNLFSFSCGFKVMTVSCFLFKNLNCLRQISSVANIKSQSCYLKQNHNLLGKYGVVHNYEQAHQITRNRASPGHRHHYAWSSAAFVFLPLSSGFRVMGNRVLFMCLNFMPYLTQQRFISRQFHHDYIRKSIHFSIVVWEQLEKGNGKAAKPHLLTPYKINQQISSNIDSFGF